MIQYIIIAFALLIICLVAFKLTRKDFSEEMNKLVTYLGGKDNILDCELSKSRFKVTLKDVSKANKEGIQKLGAKGIVEIDNHLKIIFDKNSRALKKYIKDMR
jgi:PTS system glucose-specific IIC component